MVLSVIHSHAIHIIVESQDTDVFVVLIANYKHFGKKGAHEAENYKRM